MKKIKTLIEEALSHSCDVCGSNEDSLYERAKEAKQELISLNNEIYIVYFCTGEYGDAIEEVSKVFFSKEKADKYADEKNSQLKIFNLHCDNMKDNYNFRYSEEILEQFGYAIDYTGANFSVEGPYKVE